MARVRKVLGVLVLVIIAVEVALVLTGVVAFGSAARFVIAVELTLSVFVIVEIALVIRAVRGATDHGVDVPVALNQSLRQFFPDRVARYLRQDLMLVRAIWMLATGRRDVAPGEQPLPYSGPLVLMLSALTVADGIVAILLHQLLPAGVRTLVLVLGALGLVWLIGFIASLVCYPHVISADRLRLRFSVFHDIVIPGTAIRRVGTTAAVPPTQKSAARLDDQLMLVVSGQANVVVDLDPTEFTSLNPKIDTSGMLHRATFYTDDLNRARQLLAHGART